MRSTGRIVMEVSMDSEGVVQASVQANPLCHEDGAVMIGAMKAGIDNLATRYFADMLERGEDVEKLAQVMVNAATSSSDAYEVQKQEGGGA